MRQVSLYFAAFLLLSPLFAQAKPAMQFGFEERDSSQVPEAVKAQSRFVYRLDIPFFTTTTQAAYEELLQLPSFPAEAKEDIKICQQAGFKVCAIRFGAWRGSAFLDQSGDAVWTNCHMVHGWITYERQALLLNGVAEKDLIKALMKKEIPLRLTDAGGKIQDIGSASLEAFVAVSRLKPAELECSLGNDAVKLKLARPLAESGIPRVRSIQEGETLFIGGFPRKTGSRAARGFGDSDGESFYWTHGPHLPKGEASREFFGNDNFNLALSGPYTEGILADGIEGMSGGPVMNERGEVVGTYKGYLPLDKESKDTPLISIIFSDLRFVEIFAEGL